MAVLWFFFSQTEGLNLMGWPTQGTVSNNNWPPLSFFRQLLITVCTLGRKSSFARESASACLVSRPMTIMRKAAFSSSKLVTAFSIAMMVGIMASLWVNKISFFHPNPPQPVLPKKTKQKAFLVSIQHTLLKRFLKNTYCLAGSTHEASGD